ncbi:unnamed protein product [Linum trigynum]|uniref:Uncharacterized protein n=1 Tax=Linum trigynum TaxID=586398 RepID=A0AAV2E2U5_9ROSI
MSPLVNASRSQAVHFSRNDSRFLTWNVPAYEQRSRSRNAFRFFAMLPQWNESPLLPPGQAKNSHSASSLREKLRSKSAFPKARIPKRFLTSQRIKRFSKKPKD